MGKQTHVRVIALQGRLCDKGYNFSSISNEINMSAHSNSTQGSWSMFSFLFQESSKKNCDIFKRSKQVFQIHIVRSISATFICKDNIASV